MLAVAIPYHAGDAHLALELVRWIGKLGSLKEFDCVLVVDCATPIDSAIAVKEEAEKVFKSTSLVINAASVSGWIPGANSLWYRAMDWALENERSILFLEPDSVPLQRGWLQELNVAYSAGGKAHMGYVAETNNSMLPPKCMSGVAIYSPEAAHWPRPPQKYPFNVFYADLILQNAAHTPLIKDFFGQHHLPPVFVVHEQPDEPAHHLSLDWLPKEAVLYHRDKTHSLIPLLATKFGIEWRKESAKRNKICVVIPVHGGDVALALHHAMWFRKLGRRWEHPAIIAFDATAVPMVNQLKNFLEPVFQGVEMFQYPHFSAAYPHAANFAFQSVAHRMAQGDAPWLFCEPDTVVLTPDWIERLQAEYDSCGCSWMGPHVKGMSHANGVMVYPADAARRMPRAMSCAAGQAFDMEAAAEIMHDCHDCDHLLFHTWSILNGRWHPVGGGIVPVGITVELARQIPKSAVAIHRVKDRSLVDLLLTGQYRH